MSSPSDRLYNLLPAVYRSRDSTATEPLRALLGLIQQEYDGVEQNIAQLYENWFIETCDEWVIPYIGDLLGVRAAYPASSGTFSPRAYVAHALDYRRKKGTAAMLEQLASDVTGWPARVVEFFELLSTTQYLNHLRPQNVITPDLRDTSALELLGGPFETVSHTADIRHISSGGGRYNIPSIGLFLWRVQDYLIGPISLNPKHLNAQSDARAVATPTDGRYTFDPTGVNAPLFNLPQTKTDATLLVSEINVPGLLRRRPLYDELEAVRQSEVDAQPSPAPVYFGNNPVFQIMVNGAVVPFDQVMICDIADVSATDWRRPPATKPYMPFAGGAAINKPLALSVDPVQGRIAFPVGVTPASVEVSFVYGFSGDLGAGSYDRSTWLSNPSTSPSPLTNPNRWQVAVSQTLAAVPSLVFPSFDLAIKSWNAQPAGTDGVIVVVDSRSYLENPTQIEIPVGSRLLIVAADWPAVRQSPVTNKNLDPSGLRPHLRGQLEIKGVAPAASPNPGQFFIDGLMIEGSVTVVSGNLGAFSLSHSTIVPSAGISVASSAGGSTDNETLAVSFYRAICGPISLSNLIPSLSLTDSIVCSGLLAAANVAAITAPGASMSVTTTTVFGTVGSRIVNASDSVFTGILNIQRQQTGCARYCYIPPASQTPRRYQCQPDLALTGITDKASQDAIRVRLIPQFTSLASGQPTFAQLASTCAVEIRTGAENEAEMGAFNFLQQPQRNANLLSALDEYLRFGLEAGSVEET